MPGPEAGGSSETVGGLKRRLTALLREAGIDTPDLDARLLLGHVLDLDLTGQVMRAGEPVDAAGVAAVLRLGAERVAGKPVGRILGRRGFYGLEFALSAGTLEPRPDTEVLVDAALEFLAGRGAAPGVIADIGTGSGAILIALLANAAAATGLAIDICEDALRTTWANAVRNGVASRLLPVRASYAEALASGAFDLVVSNPPYIATEKIARLAPDVREHDPLAALDGGADGLDAYRALVPRALAALKPDGALIVEIGYDQADAVSCLMRESGYAAVSVRPDLAGRARVVAGRRA
ncbi:MAG: peptide chain release factor N(5)-glutamine methyltransferase [Ancalomicrobiaceae bacterium]|nr:peptide chain release factor N(5)-glutamine methyltransferase [Ancalomicrobiaceae bacterium]